MCVYAYMHISQFTLYISALIWSVGKPARQLLISVVLRNKSASKWLLFFGIRTKIGFVFSFQFKINVKNKTFCKGWALILFIKAIHIIYFHLNPLGWSSDINIPLVIIVSSVWAFQMIYFYYFISLGNYKHIWVFRNIQIVHYHAGNQLYEFWNQRYFQMIYSSNFKKS